MAIKAFDSTAIMTQHFKFKGKTVLDLVTKRYHHIDEWQNFLKLQTLKGRRLFIHSLKKTEKYF